MKFLILFLVSFNLYASFLPDSKVGVEFGGEKFTRASDCHKHYAEDCIKAVKDYKWEYHILIQDRNLKDKTGDCYTEQECDDAFIVLECDEGFRKIKNYNLNQVYCTRFVSKHIAVDPAKKLIFDASEKEREDKEKKEKAAKKAAKDYLKGLDCSTLKNPDQTPDAFRQAVCNYIKR